MGVPREFSFRFLSNVVVDRQYLEPLANTLHFGSGSGSTRGINGVPMAWAVSRTDMPGQRFSRRSDHCLLTAPYLSALAYIMLLGPNAGLLNKALKTVFGLQEAPSTSSAWGRRLRHCRAPLLVRLLYDH